MRMRLVICDSRRNDARQVGNVICVWCCELQCSECTAAPQSHRHKGQGCFPECHPTLDMSNPLKSKVIALYKNLLYLGREYPQGAAYFREKLKAAFMKNKDETDPEKIEKLVKRGDFVIKELAALYFLRKYRAIKKRYYDKDEK